MKNRLLLFGLALCLVLSGCSAGEVPVETVADWIPEDAIRTAGPMVMDLVLPEDAVLSADGISTGSVYQQPEGKYEITREIAKGTAASVLKQLTGIPVQRLQPVKQREFDMDRYDFAWASTGEDGLQVCHGRMYSDGTYCYCLVFRTPEDQAEEYRDCMAALFDSIGFHGEEGF